ncbi:ABC-2 transporter permease [Clostridium estertheticum]|uniref:ABC-2 transporter permease n=1 Tax=Clostridium estertheticum TaxID=238834 RepID=A0A5N7J7K4_9CLOT|nr:ABC-2 transporter permease [Clostridium estertheticum]MPQ34269.1 ABC-2 transporter permease [Clostridium estertheticum]MPQ64692.1 ABC-2 transporter permease [Clostridium estertheticum]
MSEIISSIKLDFYSMKHLYSGAILAIIIGIIIGFVTNPITIIMVEITFSAYFLSMCFAVHDKSNFNKLYGVLPINKNQIVIGRYLFSTCFVTAMGILSFILYYFISTIMGGPFNIVTSSASVCGSFIIFALFIGIQFPLYYKYEYSKVMIISILPFVLVFAIGVPVISKILKNADNMKKLINSLMYFQTHPYMIWVLGIGIGFLLLVFSGVTSCVLFRKREL